MTNSFQSFLLTSNKEKRDNNLPNYWIMNGISITIVQLTAYTLKLAHCIMQNEQEKFSVTAFEKRQEMYQYCQNRFLI